MTETLLFRLALLIGYAIVTFFVFRWAVKKHIEPYVPANATLLLDYGNRFSLKNPYLMGGITYIVLTAFGLACIGPLTEWFSSQATAATSFLVDFIFDGLVGFLPFVMAVKYVTLKGYHLQRLLPFLGLVILLTFSTGFAIGAAKTRQTWTFRNQVYCELLKPGMSKTEVDTALKPIGLTYQLKWVRDDLKGPPVPGVVAFTLPSFDSPDIEYGLLLVLGYDSNDHLVMVGHRGPLSFNYESVECPLPFC